MAENGEKRSPTAHRTRGQMIRKNHTADATPKAIQSRTDNNKARAIMTKAGLVHKGDGKDVHHVKPQRSGGATVRSNLAVKSAHDNRGWEKEKK